ncbi:MAG: hypothetical protein ACP5XB_27615 [Isosphaeraceae bacterium]
MFPPFRDMMTRQLVEDRGGLGVEHQRDGIQRVFGRQGDRNELEAKPARRQQFLPRLEWPARLLDVPDLEAREIDPRRPREGLIDGGRVEPVVAVDGVEDDRAVLDRSGDRAPILSINQPSDMQPCRLTRPNVGRKPDAPRAWQAETMLPSIPRAFSAGGSPIMMSAG